MIAPYGWLPWISGDVTVKGQDASVATKPKDLITRFCAFLSVDNEYRKKAFIASQRVNMLGICQKNNAKSIAVGVIYLISQIYRLGLTKKLISTKCGTSEVTINNTYLEMYRFKKFLLD